MERHALDTEDDTAEEEKRKEDVGNSTQVVADDSGKTEECVGNTAQTEIDEHSVYSVDSWIFGEKDNDDVGNTAEVNREQETEEKESELTEEDEHFNNVLTQVLEGNNESLATCSTRVLMDVNRVAPDMVEARLKDKTIQLKEWLDGDWKRKQARKGKSRGKGKGKTPATKAR